MNFWHSITYDLPEGKKNIFQVFLMHYINPKYRIIKAYRLAKYFGNSKNKLFKLISARLRAKMILNYGCDLHIDSIIGKNLRLTHPIGVVIGAGVKIQNSVTIFQNVTLGSHGKENSNTKEYPVISNNVIIYSGATIIGNVTIGENSIIGANTFVNKNIPPNHIAFGNPLIIKQRDSNK